MRSMTGFGIGYAACGNGQLCVELKSLNHRYLDVRVRVPTDFGDHAFFLEHLARSRLVRGRFDIQLRAEGAPTLAPRLDADRVRDLFRQVAILRDELAPSSDVPLAAIVGLPAMYVEADARRVEHVREAIESAFALAQKRLDVMRAEEGLHLSEALRELLGRATELARQCADRAKETVPIHRDRLRERVAKLLDDPGVTVDSGRLEQEIALIADRCDVTEELARLDSHFRQFSRLIDCEEPTGRRMDFLLQEIGRESNTLGSKSQDALLSHLVVELKAEMERMREQVQNVE